MRKINRWVLIFMPQRSRSIFISGEELSSFSLIKTSGFFVLFQQFWRVGRPSAREGIFRVLTDQARAGKAPTGNFDWCQHLFSPVIEFSGRLENKNHRTEFPDFFFDEAI